MKILTKKIRWYYLLIVAGIGLFSFTAADNYFEISKNLELYASVFREINTYYVDDIDAGKLNKKAIDEMLRTLDPYTNFISEAEAEDFRFQMTGQYGGVGSQIVQKGDYVVITDPYEGYPAQKADLRAGDLLVKVEGNDIKNKSTSDVSKLLKGQPGSSVNIVIKRNGVEMNKTLVREEIKVKNVPYYGLINPETGYIKLTGFTQDAGKEVREALLALKKQNIKQVILDLRGNPGGLLHEAVNIVNVFVPQGKQVVFTKGKVSEWDKSYETSMPVTDATIPLTVLVNRGSASASEIVSGTIQDLDRGIVIGQRSFGKGLVQSTRPLNYNTQIKITTAKYHTPSGRCIQALDYSHRNEDGSVGSVPDSLKKEFKTKNGRKVFDGGGIDPDVKIEIEPLSQLTQSLLAKLIIFDFATDFRNKHDSIGDPKAFILSNEEFENFKKYVQTQDVDYSTQTEKELEELKKKAEKENYFEAIKESYETMKKQLKHDKLADLDKNKVEIISLIEEEIVRRYYYQKGRIEASFAHDKDIIESLRLFGNPTQFNQVLAPLPSKK
ncbi:MAG: S41 family peptidase [Bacteroidia bacterium]|nr:S41 family peptidase [Bacteroidia bacterium]MCF8426872.1 S41 family peptidase [Bacteroidia bacterium]